MERITAAAVSVGLPGPSVPFLLALLLNPLVSALHTSLFHGAAVRHATSVLLGCALCLSVFDLASTGRLFVPVAFSYALMLVSRKFAGVLVFVASFAYLIFCHVEAASGLAWKEGRVDYTGTLMVVVLKLISTAFDYTDGARGRSSGTSQKDVSLSHLPSPLAYLGYVLYPATLLAGPWLPFRDYQDFTAGKGDWAAGRAAPPRLSFLLPMLRCCLLGLACAAVHALMTPHFPDSAFMDEAWLVRTSFWERIAFMWAMSFAARCKYYFVWKWAEAACDASGLGWSGTAWDRCRNIDVAGVELATSSVAYPLNWNTRTGLWLRYYVYERLAPPAAPASDSGPPAEAAAAGACRGGKKKRAGVSPFLALLITQTISGLWHGIFAGYAFFFIGSVFMLHSSKVMYRHQQRLASPGSALARLLTLLHGLVSTFHLSYLASTFIIITLPGSLAAWRSVGWAGHYTLGAIVAIGFLLPAPRAKRVKKTE